MQTKWALKVDDVVLGLAWLRSLGNALWDFKSTKTSFKNNGHSMELKAQEPNKLKVYPEKARLRHSVKAKALSSSSERLRRYFWLFLRPVHQCCFLALVGK